MRDDSTDPIIDSLLDEVLGEQQPPDLTQQILRAHQLQDKDAEPSTAEPTSIPPDVEVEKRIPRKTRVQRSNRSRMMPIISSLAIVLVAGFFAVWVWQQENALKQANQPSNPGVTDQENNDAGAQIARQPRHDKFAGQEVVGPLPTPPQIADSQPSAVPAGNIEPRDLVSPKFERSIPLGEPATKTQVVRLINDRLKSGWRKAQLSPVGYVDDETWFARAARVTLGRPASEAERKEFLRHRDKEAALDRFLTSAEFANHWGKQFGNILVGAATSNAFDRASLDSYLASALRQNKPYDQLAFELLTARGGNQPDSEQYNPAVNFLLAYETKLPSKATAADKICQVFLGKQMQCARCHDHPTETAITQKDYWQIAAYLTQMQASPALKGTLLADVDFAGEKGNSPRDAELYFERPDKTGDVAYPIFLDGQMPGTNSGRVADINRRQNLAHAILASDEFSLATINRLWRKVFRTGFTSPVDDMGPHQQPSHPKLLEDLAREFRNSQFSVRDALQWMISSDAFRLGTRPSNDPLAMQSDAFTSFRRSDQIYFPAIDRPLAQLAKAYGTAQPFDPTTILGNLGSSKKMPAAKAAKAMALINDRHRQELLNTRPGSLISRLAENRELPNDVVVDHLFYALVGRAPSPRERKHGSTILSSDRRRIDCLLQIGQIILSSNEFKQQH